MVRRVYLGLAVSASIAIVIALTNLGRTVLAQQADSPNAHTETPPALKLEFTISEPLGLLRFLNGISKQSDEGHSYLDFLSSHYKLRKDDKGLIWEYVLVRRAKSEFEIVSGRKLSLNQQLMAIACNTKSFDEFYKAAKPYCSDEEFDTYQRVMNHFRPIYELLIWKPFSPQLNKDVAWFRDNEQAFARPLVSVAKLSQSSAGRERALKAAIVPAPAEVKKEGSGYMYSSSAFSENLDLAVVLSMQIVPPDTIAAFNDPRVNNKRTLEDNAGLIHEFTHNLWAFRNPEFKKALISSFERKGTQFNYDLLNESQASAIAAWFHKQVTGKDKPGQWYDNAYVDKYSKVLLPVLQEFGNLNAAQGALNTLNADDYADKAITAFEKTFPNWQIDPQIILWRSQIVQSPLSAEDLAADLNDKLFEFKGGDHKVTVVKGETWPARFANYSKDPKRTTVFLLHPNQIDTVQKYFGLSQQIADDLNTLVTQNKDTDEALVKAVKTEQRWLVFVISNRQTFQKQGLLKYAMQLRQPVPR